ncbi:MAG: cytochrome P450 [Candidatus Actinomarinales bacterium]|nr:MAG: cytochrome P450 [Candidatus Actinomarinales bacterium]
MNIPEFHLPTTDSDFIKDPYPTLKEFREKTPIFWDEINSLLFITRYKDVRKIQSSKVFGTTFNHIEGFEDSPDNSTKPLTYVGYKRADKYATYDNFWKSEEFSLLNLEGELHGELRGLVAKAFLPRSVQKLVPFMEKKSSDLFSKTGDKPFDLLKEYAQPYSISVIGELLGVPEEDHNLFLDWSHRIVKMYDFEVSKEDAESAEDAARDFYDYSLDLLNERRSNPKDDMITRLSQVSENNVYLTDQQIICTMILLLNAGHEATVNTLGNGLRALVSNNIDFDEIKNKNIPTKDVVEELIRWDSPLQFFLRYVLEDAEIGEYNIPKKSKVAILLGSANHDGEQFEKPTEINFQREDKDHSSWGGGIHFCIGAHLARLELEVSFDHILSKNFTLDQEPERTGAFGIRGFKELHVSINS